MNKARRKAIEEIGDQLVFLYERIEEIRDEEQEYLDNMLAKIASYSQYCLIKKRRHSGE